MFVRKIELPPATVIFSGDYHIAFIVWFSMAGKFRLCVWKVSMLSQIASLND
jgi:hypothetical protein